MEAVGVFEYMGYGKGSCKSYLLLRRDGPTAFERVSLPSLDAARYAAAE